MVFDPYLQGRNPFATGTPFSPSYGSTGLPTPGGMAGMALQQFGYSPFMSGMQGRGWVPLGFHDQNLYDALTAQRVTQAHEESLRQAAEGDRRNFMSSFRGMALMSGTPWGGEQQRAARRLTDAAVAMAPMMAMTNPQLLDQLSGPAGSQTVMNHFMHMGGRYRYDPVTGQMGMSANTVGTMSTEVFSAMQRDRRGFAGMTAGQAGTLFDEMTRRGMMGNLASFSEADQMRSAISTVGVGKSALLDQIWQRQGSKTRDDGSRDIDIRSLNTDELHSLKSDTVIQGQVRKVDAARVTQSLKAYSSAISAVREIFGDAGHSDAPMAELMNMLEQLSGGNLSQIDPGRLSMMVRNTRNLAKNAGVSMEAALMMQGHAMATASGLGLDQSLATQAVQGSLAFGAAYRDSERNGQYTTWGALGSNQVQQLDLNLRVSAAGSQAANQMGAVMRLSRAVGGFAEGSEAAALADAINKGRTSYNYGGKTSSIDVDPGRLTAILQGGNGNINEGTVNSYLQQNFANQEMVERHGLGNLTRKMQADEFEGYAGNEMSSVIRASLMAKGMDAKTAGRLAAKMGGAAASTMMGMSNEKYSKVADRNKILGAAMREAAGAEGGQFDDQFYALTSDQLTGHMDKAIGDSEWSGLKSIQGARQVMGRDALAAGERQQLRATMQSERQEIMAGITPKGSVLARVIGELQRSEGTDAKSVVAAALKMARAKDLAPALGESLVRLRDREQGLKAKEEAIMKMEPGDARDRAVEALKAEREQLAQEAKTLTDTAEKAGVFTSTGMGVGDTEAMLGSHAWVSGQMDKLAGKDLGGGFWTSETGKDFASGVNRTFLHADDLSKAALQDEKLIGRMGKEGIKKAQRLGGINDRLVKLAVKYTGGDVARLMAGEGVPASVMDEVRGLRAEQEGIATEMDEAMRGTGKGEITPELKKAMEGAREEQAGNVDDLEKRLLSAYGLDPGDMEGSEQGRRIRAVLGKTGGKALAEAMIEKAGTSGDTIGKRHDDGDALIRALESAPLPTDTEASTAAGDRAQAVSIPGGIEIRGNLSFDFNGLKMSGFTSGDVTA